MRAHIATQLRLAEAACKRHDLATARRLFHEVLAEKPGDYAGLCGMAYLHFVEKRYADALNCLARAMEGSPKETRAIDLSAKYARVAGEQGADLGYCVTHLRRAIRLSPEHAECRYALALLYLRAGDRTSAAKELRRVIATAPNHLPSLECLARLAKAARRLDDAVNYLKQAVRALDAEGPLLNRIAQRYGRVSEQPAQLRATLLEEMAEVQRLAGNRSEALSCWRSVARLKPESAKALYYLAMDNDDDEKNRRQRESRLAAIGHNLDFDRDNRAWANFALGHLAEQRRDYDEAFTRYAEANRHVEAGYSSAKFHTAVDSLTHVFDREYLAMRAKRGVERRSPIFVVGMPMAGVSQVAGILAAAGACVQRDRRLIGDSMVEMTRALSAGRRGVPLTLLREMSKEQAMSAAGRYLACAGADNAPLVDAFSANFANLGYIASIFPNARIIHCRREPLDVCLSCFASHFSDKREQTGYAFDLTHLGAHYLEYERLMEHWRGALPMPIFEVEYEKLAAEPRKEIAAVAQFVGVSAEDAQQSSGMVRAGEWPHEMAVGRWRAFSEHLGLLRAALGIEEQTRQPEAAVSNAQGRTFRIDQGGKSHVARKPRFQRAGARKTSSPHAD